jgi:EF hand domain-containing protein
LKVIAAVVMHQKQRRRRAVLEFAFQGRELGVNRAIQSQRAAQSSGHRGGAPHSSVASLIMDEWFHTRSKRRNPNMKRKLQLRCVSTVFVAVAVAALNSCTTNKNLQPSRATATTGAGGFEEADANHDGKLSRDEGSDFLVNEIFNSRDANHDGRMMKEEWAAGDSTRAADFTKRDADGDGIVTKEEAIKYGRAHGIANKILREADKNGDGMLDKAEVQAYYASREGPPR